MTEMQEIEAFAGQVRADEAWRTMLEDVTRSVAAEGEGPSPTRLDPTAGLWLGGVVGLWKIVKVGIDHLRGRWSNGCSRASAHALTTTQSSKSCCTYPSTAYRTYGTHRFA